MFCKVALNTELVLPQGNMGSVSCEPLVTCLLTDQFRILFYVCLFKDTSFNILLVHRH